MEKKFKIFQIIFELVAVNSPYYYENTRIGIVRSQCVNK